MSMPFEVYTDHYALQWLKTMRTGPALLHLWSAALEEYDFAPPRKIPDARRWAQPPTRRSPTHGRHRSPSTALGGQGRGPQDCPRAPYHHPPRWTCAMEALQRLVFAQSRPPHLPRNRSELSPMSIGHRLWPLPENGRHYPVSRPLGYVVH